MSLSAECICSTLCAFRQVGFMSRKVNRHVLFPLMLDVAPYCSSLCCGVPVGHSKVSLLMDYVSGVNC